MSIFGKDRPDRSGRHPSGEPVAPEIRGMLAALRRSTEIARQIAYLTGTDVILVREGRLVREAGSASYDLDPDPRSRPLPGNVRPLNRPTR
ncbi:MAG: hypothetical protein RL654_772 [Pseudomonadota bacterium]|jgi:hypothetical protein